MFGKHVTKLLSAYCHDELTASESSRVAKHLQTCARCRVELDNIKLGIAMAERLPTVSAPDSLWSEVKAALSGVSRRDESRWRLGALLGWRQIAVVGGALVAVIVVGLVWRLVSRSAAPWEVIVLDPGYVQISGEKVFGSGKFYVDDQLETSAARVKVKVGVIGEVDVEFGSRLTRLQARPLEHRLGLERGRVHARISAPPRLFFVNTPSAEAIDLGCAYTLEVNEAGDAFLQVTEGSVQLVLGARESTVPPGAACVTRAGIGPGTPYFEDSSPGFQAALAVFDFGFVGDRDAALNQLLSEARRRDSLTLWNLLSRVDLAERERVYDRLAYLVPPPSDVSREGVMALDERMLESWFFDVQRSWF